MGGIVKSIFGGPPKPPPAPNPSATIQAQSEAQQIAQFTPSGNLLFGTLGADGQFVPRETGTALQVTESPFQEQFRLGQEQLALGLLGSLGADLGGFRSAADIEAGLTPFQTDFSAEAEQLEQETFEAAQARLQPVIEQERRDLIQNLADRGLPLTSEAAQEELRRFDQSVGDRRSEAAFGAVAAGRAEQDRLARLTSALRGQQINEQFGLANIEQQQRAQQFGEIGALGGFAAPFQPLNAPTVDAAGIINQSYANQLSAANLAQQQHAQNLQFAGDIAGTAATAFALSDERLKENIVFHSKKNGYNLYDFNYKDEPDITFRGVMAQEVLETDPDAVAVMPNGFYGVYYDKLGLKMETVRVA